MFISSGQFWYFLLSLSYGIIVGPLYSFMCMALIIKNNKIIKNIIDVIFFIVLAIGYFYFSYYYSFPTLRGYMIIGVLVGFYGYLKSFHIMLAKLYKKVYNLKKMRGKNFGRK